MAGGNGAVQAMRQVINFLSKGPGFDRVMKGVRSPFLRLVCCQCQYEYCQCH